MSAIEAVSSPRMVLYLGLAGAAFAYVLLLTPIVAAAAARFGLVDAPGGRKVHSAAVPRLGGLAVLGAVALAWLTVHALAPRAGLAGHLDAVGPLLAGGALVFAVGLADDVRPMPAWLKLAVQSLAAAVVMASGLLIARVTILDHTWPLGVLAWPVTLVWIVGLTNAFNLIDGVDGLAAGTAGIAAAACAAILIARGHAAEAALLAPLVGAAVGFLAYNFAPASIFLGDGGSLLFGFALATTAIAGWQKGATALAAGVPLLIFALPIADAASALVRRLGRRSAPGDHERHGLRVPWTRKLGGVLEPDRQHIHHWLLARGWSVRQVVLGLYAITAALAILAIATADLGAP